MTLNDAFQYSDYIKQANSSQNNGVNNTNNFMLQILSSMCAHKVLRL